MSGAPEIREQAWTEYILTCSLNKTHYFKDRSQSYATTNHRELALATLGHLTNPDPVNFPNSVPCAGVHALESRTIERVTTTGPWGAINETAPVISTRDRILHECLKHVCPKCDADLGHMCINLSKKVIPPLEVKWPHAERMNLAGIDHDGAMIR